MPTQNFHNLQELRNLKEVRDFYKTLQKQQRICTWQGLCMTGYKSAAGGSGVSKHLYLAFLLLATSLFVSPLALSLPSDREQPIHITADKAVRDEKKGVTIYSGSVQMRQGSMELEADSLTIFHDVENADQIVARGKPAKMRQRPELEAAVVHAHAGVITYFKLEDRVLLQSEARIEREGELVTGDSIDYLIGQQLITAEANKSTAGDKVSVVLQPTIPPAPPTPPTPPTQPLATPSSAGQEGPSGTPKSE